MPLAARLTDMHTCPMVTPGLPPIPHVGGPIIGKDIQTENGSESSLQESSIEIPEFLEGDKVERAKSYTEHMKRGKVLHIQGYHSLAIAEYEAALKISGPNPSPIIQIGIIHFGVYVDLIIMI